MSLSSLLEKYTVRQLRDELENRDIFLPKSSRKSDLIETLVQELSNTDPLDSQMEKDVQVFRKATQRRKFCTWVKLPDQAVTKYLTVLKDEPMGLDPRKELIYRAAKFGYLSGFQGELQDLLALLLYSLRELEKILVSQDYVPEKSGFDRIYQILREGALPHRPFYELDSLPSLTKGDWEALRVLFGENPLEQMVKDELMEPLPMEMSIKDISNAKLLELAKFAKEKEFDGSIEDLKRVCPQLQRMELQRYLGGREREENTIVSIFRMFSYSLLEELHRIEVDCHENMPEAALRAALVYATATPNLISRRPKRRSKFTELEHAFRLAVDGTLTDLDKVMIPTGVDRILVEQELRNLAEYENSITTTEYALLRTLESYSIQYGLGLFQLPDVHRLTRPQLLFILVHRQLPPGTDLDGMEERYNRVADLLSIERAALMLLHHTNEMSVVMNAPDTPVDCLIHRVIKWRRNNERKKILNFAERKGVLLPTRLYESSDWPSQYSFVLSDLTQYGPILNRSRRGPWTLEEQTDLELVERFGLIPVYQSRTELLMGYQNERPQFWIPVDVTKAQNTQSPLTIDDLDNEMEEILYAEGTRDKFHIVTAEELRQLIQQSNNYTIPNPFPGQGRNWSMQDALPIARELEDVETVNLLDAKLRVELSFLTRDYTPEQHAWFIRIFRKMTEAAMYMRRWMGPGTPYPLAADETTRTDNWSYEVGITDSLRELNDLRQESGLENIFSSLKVQSCAFSDYRLCYILTGVQSGTFCIRVASAYLIKSGIVYLGFLGETFEDPVRGRIITIEDIEAIQ